MVVEPLQQRGPEYNDGRFVDTDAETLHNERGRHT